MSDPQQPSFPPSPSPHFGQQAGQQPGAQQPNAHHAGAPQPSSPYGQQGPQHPSPQYGQQPGAQQPSTQYGQPPGTQQPFGQAAPQHPGYYGAPHAQPAYGQQPYPQNAGASGGAGGGLARLAFILALVGFAISTLYSLIYPFIFLAQPMDYEGLGVLGFVVNLLGFLAAAAALILGLISLRRTDSRLLAGIAIGVGGAQVIGVLVGWVSSLFYGLG